MTKKIRENLLILLISNIITIILFVTAPYIIRVVTSTNATENNNLMLSPLPILLYLILLSLLVCIITVLYRLHTEKRIIINNSITSLQPATSEKNKAEIMREIYKNKQDHLEVNRYEAIKEYTYTVFSPYMLFYANHPLEGARVLACPCMTETYEKKFYGSEPIFIYDKNNSENRPVRGVHNNVLRRWNAFPALLRDTFIQEFSSVCLHDQNKRKLERQWQNIIQQLRDMLVVCPRCKEETFVENPNAAQCMCCGKPFTISGIMKINDRKILLTPEKKVYIDMDNKPDIQVISIPGDRYPVQLKNITTNNWVVETPSGKIKPIEPNKAMPVKVGLKVSLTGAIKGEII